MGERKAEGGDGDVERIRIIKKIDDKTDKEKRDKGLKAPKAQNKRWRHRHTKLEHCIPPAPPPPPPTNMAVRHGETREVHGTVTLGPLPASNPDGPVGTLGQVASLLVQSRVG